MGSPSLFWSHTTHNMQQSKNNFYADHTTGYKTLNSVKSGDYTYSVNAWA